ncbi:MAG TPA: hypothetical protein VN783_04870 [Thermoanaerobaculia bacterium]|nr:hypothetical protein [Thermoanaerobaculia bacterium]
MSRRLVSPLLAAGLLLAGGSWLSRFESLASGLFRGAASGIFADMGGDIDPNGHASPPPNVQGPAGSTAPDSVREIDGGGLLPPS